VVASGDETLKPSQVLALTFYGEGRLWNMEERLHELNRPGVPSQVPVITFKLFGAELVFKVCKHNLPVS